MDEKKPEELTWKELRARQQEIYDQMMREIEEKEKLTNWPVAGRLWRDEHGEEWIISETAGKMDRKGRRFWLDGTPLLQEDGTQAVEPDYGIAAASLAAARDNEERWALAGRYARGWTPDPPMELAPMEETHEYTSPTYGRIGPERIRQKYTVICSHCPAAIWHINQTKGIRIFCSLMRAVLILNQLKYGEQTTYLQACDGYQQAMEAWREAQKEQEA